MASIIEKARKVFSEEDVKIINKNKIEINISASNLEDFLSNIKKIITNEKISRSQY
jgi:hypothetical protein